MIYKYEHPEYFKDLPPVNYKDYDCNIVVFGAGALGAMAARLLEKKGVKIICFADSNPKKQGTEYLGYPVISPEEMKERYFDAAILITPYNVRSAHETIQDMGFRTILPSLFLFLEFETDDIKDVLPLLSLTENNLDAPMVSYMRRQAEFFCLGFGALKHLDIIVTERCTLRCKECSFFMPYYKEPRDFDWQELKKSLNRLLELASFYRIDILGGELFLYKQLPELLELLILSPRVQKISLLSNATIIPNKRTQELLRNRKIVVRLSDYGKNSYRINDLADLFNREKINFYVRRPDSWQSLTEICPPNIRSEKQIQDIYVNCCSFNGAAVLSNGILYRCPFASNAEKLGIISPNINDSVDLLAEPYCFEETAKKIEQFYERENFIDACRYCNGRDYRTKQVPVAEQMVGEPPELPNYRKENN